MIRYLTALRSDLPARKFAGIFDRSWGDQSCNGRRGRVRTDDPLLPKQVRYQAALHSEFLACLLLLLVRLNRKREALFPVVRTRRLELPGGFLPQRPQRCASTNFATSANSKTSRLSPRSNDGALGGTRTLNAWYLKPVRIPIPPRAHGILV